MEPNEEEMLPILDSKGEDWKEYSGAKIVKNSDDSYAIVPLDDPNHYTDSDATAVDLARNMMPTVDPMAVVLESNARIEAAVNRLVDTVGNVATLVGQIQEQIGPTLETLQSNPMVKMLFGGKR